MVANLPYDFSEDKVSFEPKICLNQDYLIIILAQGTLRCVQP